MKSFKSLTMPAEYRKYPNGKEFLKLVNGQVISVFVTDKSVRIIATTNTFILEDFHNEAIACTSAEFNKAMSTALFEITKND